MRNFSQQQQTSHERIDLGAVNFTSKASDMNFTALAIKYQTILDIANKTLPACVNVTSLGDDEDDNEWRKQRDIAYQLTMDGNEHFMRFEFADALKKYDLALDNLIVVNKTATWRSTLLLSQALSLDMLDKSEEAVKKANEALKLEPNRTDIQSFIGTFYLWHNGSFLCDLCDYWTNANCSI